MNLRFKECRKSLGKTQADIAALIGITRGAYANIETGRREPDFATLSTLADYFNVSIDYLLGREEKDPPSLAIESGHSKEAIEFAKAHPELTEEEWEELERYALLLIAAKKAKEPVDLKSRPEKPGRDK